MTDVGRQVYRYFLGHGLSRAGAAGVVGNARQESSLNPNDPGGGLFQDIGSRAPSGRGPLQHQLDSAYHELAQMPGLLSALRHTGDPAKAARLFSEQFERPGEPMLGNRESYARQAAHAYGGATGLADVNGGSPLETRQSVVEGAPAASGAAIAALTQALAQQQAPQQQLGRPARPSFSAGPHLPEGARGVKPLAPSSQPDNSLKLLLAAAQAEAQAPGVPSVQTEQAPAAGAAPAAAPASSPQGVEHLKGTVQFDGKPVAAWIAPILRYGQTHGWKGSVNSGYRTFAEQKAIYDSGVRPAAVPGTSNHEGKAFPRGAVDVSNATELAAILAHSPYRGVLVYAGSKDPVHFSHPHNGSY